MSRIFHYINNFICKLSWLNRRNNNNMAMFILSNIPGKRFLKNDIIEKEFLDNLYSAINSDDIYDIEILKKLSLYKIEKSDISNKLLFILSGGIKYRTGKKNTWIERRLLSIIDFIDLTYDKINSRIFCIYPYISWNIDYTYVPNKDVNFFIDYINLQGYRSLDKYNI